MRPYQEEYISNLKEGIALSWSGQEIPSFQEYLTQAEAQKQRAEEIELLRKRSQTKEYYEEIAKEKLGLVNGDEIVFKAE